MVICCIQCCPKQLKSGAALGNHKTVGGLGWVLYKSLGGPGKTLVGVQGAKPPKALRVSHSVFVSDSNVLITRSHKNCPSLADKVQILVTFE